MSRRSYRLQANMTRLQAEQLIAHLYLLIEQLQSKRYNDLIENEENSTTIKESEDGIPWDENGIPWDDRIPF